MWRRRPAANLPGKIALAIDPSLLDELRGKCAQGSVITVGTNGKTSTNNLLADAFEAAGCTIICNRTGANLAAGITSALLQQPAAQWGVFECDELWLAHVLPRLRSNYVLLLNLFRDQLDRCGEIDRIQTSIAGALAASPDTVLVYNADDPLCARIADEVPNRTVAYGLERVHGPGPEHRAPTPRCARNATAWCATITASTASSATTSATNATSRARRWTSLAATSPSAPLA